MQFNTRPENAGLTFDAGNALMGPIMQARQGQQGQQQPNALAMDYAPAQATNALAPSGAPSGAPKPPPASGDWAQIREGIFAGESGGDYDALFGYANRGDGPFGGVKVTDMTLAEVIDFTGPSGAYAQHVKGQIGRVATPVGAYQIVGTTLRDTAQRMGLTGKEQFTPELQERLAQEIYRTQGTGAWVGYKG